MRTDKQSSASACYLDSAKSIARKISISLELILNLRQKGKLLENSKNTTQELAKMYAACGDPNGWFDEFYSRADGDIHKIYWADLKPNPLLTDWIEKHPAAFMGKRAIVVGCGLGDDAELLVKHGCEVIAFDISPSAIAMCRKRYPNSTVDYLVADLFNHPAKWKYGFDVVYECNTIQILEGQSRIFALEAISNLVAPGGEIIVSCRSRKRWEQADSFPLPLDRNEINGFRRRGLSEIHFLSYDDKQEPPVPHFFAVYQRLD